MKTYAIVLAMLAFASIEAFAQGSNDRYLYQTGIRNTVYSEVLQENRDFWVHLPKGGDLNPNLEYPVVYLLDGSIQLKALATVYETYWGNYLPKMILVGISNRENRTRDLTTSEIKNPNMETGGAQKFSDFIEKELIPFVETKYPVTNYRTLIGHSYAGLFTINILLNRPNLFTNYIAIDPSLDWDNQKLLKQATKKLQALDLIGKSLFVSIAGPLDREKGNATLETVLKSNSENTLVSRSKLQFVFAAEKETEKNHLNISWKYYPDDIHGTVPLPSMIDGMKWLFDWYQLKDAAVYNNPETSVELLEKHINDRAKVLSNHFGYAVPPADEEMLNMGGYMFLQMGQANKAKLFFETQVKYYPWSVNAFDSLADFYISQNNNEKAIQNLKKAYELSSDETYQNKIDELKK